MKAKLPDNPSETLRRLNPHLYGAIQGAITADRIPVVASETKPKAPGKRRKSMNKTEGAFAAILEAKVRRGDIVSFEYEGMTLRWGQLDNIQYTPDFVVFEAFSTMGSVRIVFIETKGTHIWPKDMQKFKQARNEWPLFRFEMWQLKKGDWKQLL